MSQERIEHVSDTALMVAACRAMELSRPDTLVCDPFAERLAGERGMAIARALPGLEAMCFGVGVRSRFLDELILTTVAEQRIETVVCLGCGLDTRPWRLDLPPQLRWIESDFPAILEYKRAAMESEVPKCRLERIPADLNDASQRQAIFDSAGAAPGLMITEGLLMYLPADTVAALATEPPRLSGIRRWLLDLTSKEVANRVRMQDRKEVVAMRAPDHLEGEAILETVLRNAWAPLVHRSYTRDTLEFAARRFRDQWRGQSAPPRMPPPPPDDPSGIHLFGRP